MGIKESFSRRTLKGGKTSPLRHTYGEGFNLISQGVSDDILEASLDATQGSLLKLKAAYIALYPDRAKDVVPLPDGKLTFLLDECISPVCVIEVTKRYGWATHVDHMNMAGTKDPELYAFAVEKGYTAIFTRDLRHDEVANPFRSQDLTTIATAYAIECVFDEQTATKGQRKFNREALPIVIRFEGMNSPKSIEKAMQTYDAQIRYAIDFSPSPYITVSSKGVRIGPTYNDIFDEFFNPKPKILMNNFEKARIEAWTQSWTKRIIDNYPGKKLKEKDIQRIINSAKNNAVECISHRG